MAGILAFLTMPVRSQVLLNDNFSDGERVTQNLLSAGSDALIFTSNGGGTPIIFSSVIDRATLKQSVTGDIFAPGTLGTATVDAVNASAISTSKPPDFSEPLGLIPEPSTLAMASIGFLSFVGIKFFRRTATYLEM